MLQGSRASFFSLPLKHLNVFIGSGQLNWKCRVPGSKKCGVEARALELGVKINYVQHTFIEHLVYVPGARETEKCTSESLPSRSLHFCMDGKQVNKLTKHDPCNNKSINRK